MDPSQVQADSSNDVHSLENEEESKAVGKPAAPAASEDSATPAADGDTAVTDATGGSAPAQAPAPIKKRSAFRRIWDRFNIYLLLFMFIVVVAIAGIVLLTVKSKHAAQNAAKSQELTQDALKQLANTDVTVGNAKQILTVNSNAVFAGAVLIRSNLEVAGTLKVGGNLALSTLAVTGGAQLSDVQLGNLTVAGAVNLQGLLTLKNGINVTGNSNFTGSVTTTSLITGGLQLDGDLKLTHHIFAGGTIPAIVRGSAAGGGGTVSLSGSDTAGSITINTGSSPPAGCFATITFSTKFAATPHIVVTPVGSAAAGLSYYIDRTTSSFTLCSATPAAAGQSFGFDYTALD